MTKITFNKIKEILLIIKNGLKSSLSKTIYIICAIISFLSDDKDLTCIYLLIYIIAITSTNIRHTTYKSKIDYDDLIG